MIERRKTENALFDFDGALVDSMPVDASIMKGILDGHHIAYGEDLSDLKELVSIE